MMKKICAWWFAAIIICAPVKALADCPPLTGTGYRCAEQQSSYLAPFTAAGSCAFFFKSGNYANQPCSANPSGPDSRQELVVCNREIPLLPSGWNDNIQSFYLAEGTECIATEHSNYTGNFILLLPCASSNMENNTVVYEYGKTGPYPQQYSFNMKSASSIKCAPSGYFRQNNIPQGQGKMFEHAHFAGSVMNFSAGTNSAFVGSSWNDKITSVKIGPKLKCTVYNDSDYKGSSLTVGPNESVYDLSARGFNDKISSIKCEACQ